MKTKKLEISLEDADAFGEYIKNSIKPARSEMHVAVETMKSHLVHALNTGGSIRSLANWLKETKNFQVRADKLRDAVSSVLQESINETQPRSKERALFESALAKLAEDEYGCKKNKAKTDEGSDAQSDGRLLLLQQENERLQNELDDRSDAQPDERLRRELDIASSLQKTQEEEIQRLKTELSLSASMRKSLEEELQVANKQNLTAAAKYYKEGFHELRQMFIDHGHDVPEKLKTTPAISTPPHTLA